MTNAAKAIRCAVYTRVSTDAGLDQEFNSLDAQYDAASAYIRSQAHAHWTLGPENSRYRRRRVDGAAYGFGCVRHGAASVDLLSRRPKNRGPFHLLPVIAWAIFDRLS